MQTQLPKPDSHYETIIWIFMHPPKEISIGYYWDVRRSSKFSTRLGELEKKLNKLLCKRETKSFINQFKKRDDYMTYIPILSKTQYQKIYMELVKARTKKA